MTIKIDKSTEMIFTICGVCPAKKMCDIWKDSEDKRRCPYERQIFLQRMEDYIENKGVDPAIYYQEIKDLCTLHVKLWRRNYLESIFGVEVVETMRISAQSSKLETTILKMEKQLGIDRATINKLKAYPITDLNDDNSKNVDITNVFQKITLIKTGKLEIQDKDLSNELKSKEKAIIENGLAKKKEHTIGFQDLKFGEFGFPEIKPNVNVNDNQKPINSKNPDTFSLIHLDKKDKRYIPKR